MNHRHHNSNICRLVLRFPPWWGLITHSKVIPKQLQSGSGLNPEDVYNRGQSLRSIHYMLHLFLTHSYPPTGSAECSVPVVLREVTGYIYEWCLIYLKTSQLCSFIAHIGRWMKWQVTLVKFVIFVCHLVAMLYTGTPVRKG